MTRSVNEVMTLVTKAARGAGAPPAQADAFGRAAVYHFKAGRDLGHLSDALAALPNGPIMSLPIAFTRVTEAGGDRPQGQIDTGAWLPLALSYAEALPYTVEVEVAEETLRLTADLHSPAPKAPPGRLALPDSFVEQLATLAARILVPESDASRLAGAGAGLTDND